MRTQAIPENGGGNSGEWTAPWPLVKTAVVIVSLENLGPPMDHDEAVKQMPPRPPGGG